MKRSLVRPATLATAAALILAAGALQLEPASAAPFSPGTAAAGGPGAASHFDLARKDCLGTADNTSSKVWYTVAGGVLSDVYEPTIDNTNVETLQYVVTDGSTFADLQTRDMTYTAAGRPDRHAVHDHLDRRQARLPAGHQLHHRPATGHRADEHPAPAGQGQRHGRPRASCRSTRDSTRT